MKKSLTLFCTAVSLCLYAQNSVVFTNNGNFTVPSGINSLTIEVVGAGGNGGGNGGGGGGGGGYAKGVYNVVPGTVYNIVVGVAGSGPAAGTTSVSSLIQATGGANGTSVSNPNVGGGGAGGVGSGGTIANNSGGNGGGGYWTYFGGGGGGAAGPLGNGTAGGNTIVYTPGNCLTPGGSGGAGGGAPGGNGGKGAGFVDNFCNSANPAAPGQNYGGGGGGGNGNSSPAQTGAGGYCLIEYGACSPPPSPVLTSTGSALMVCSGSQASLTASGTGTVSWHASPSGTASLGTGSVFVTGSLTANTTFYIQDNSCAQSASRTAVTVSVIPVPTVSITPASQIYCVNQTITLTAMGASTYTWSNNTVGPVLTFSSPIVQNYVFTVTGTAANGCTANAGYFVPVQSNPAITTTVSPLNPCVGDQVTFTANMALSFVWSTGSTGSVTSITMPPTAVVQVTGTAFSGCTSVVTLTVNAAPAATVSITPPSATLCAGSSLTLTSSGTGNYTWTPGGVSSTLAVTPANNSTYTVIGENVFGCKDTASIGVTVNQLPQVGLNATSTLICSGASAVITATGASSYSWNVPGQAASLTVSPQTLTSYSVTGTDVNTCSASAVISISVSACTGFKENELFRFSVFPNPSDGKVVIRAAADTEITLSDMNGKVVEIFRLEKNNAYTKELESLAPGIYILRDVQGNSEKLLVE